MAKGKSTWKYNKLLTARRNYFVVGGGINSINRGMAYNFPGIAPEVPGIGGNTGVIKPDLGDVRIDQGQGGNSGGIGLFNSIGSIGMQAASDIAGMINNINSNDIKEKAAQVANGIKSSQMAAQTSSDSFDTLISDIANTRQMSHVTAKQLGAKDFGQGFGDAFVAGNKGFAAGAGLGPIGAAASAVGSTVTSIIGNVVRNRKIKEEAEKLNELIDYTNMFNERSLANRATNLGRSQLTGLESNYAAFGGPMDFGGGAIDYDFMNQYLGIKELAALGKDSSLGSLPNSFADGGGIHIKKANRGKFTEYCGGKVTSECIARGKRSSSPAVRKRATFAANARKWKHALGGNLYQEGGPTYDFTGYKSWNDRAVNTDNVSYIYSELRRQGVPQNQALGILGSVIQESGGDPDATNGVGIGLLQWNKDRAPKDLTLKGQTQHIINTMRNHESPHWSDGGRGFPETMSAEAAYNGFMNAKGPYEAAMYYNKGYVRPGASNNPQKAKLAEQDRVRRGVEAGRLYDFLHKKYRGKKNSKAFGGDLLTHGANFDTGVTVVGNGGTHEENPYEGVPMGVDNEGTPNLVEQGEVIFNDYVFSNRLKVPKEIKERFKLKGTKPLTFAEAAIKMGKESEERPNDPISKAGLEDSMMKLMMVQEQVRVEKDKNRFAKGGKIGKKYWDGSLLDRPIDMNDVSWMESLGLDLTDDITQNEWYKEKFTPLAGTINPSTTMASIEDSTAYPNAGTIPVAITNTYGDGKTKGKSRDFENRLAPTWMRYIPAFASGIMSATDALGLTNKPDFSEADMVLDAARGAASYNPVSFGYIGNYLDYTPFDRQFYINQMNAQSGATRRAIMNNAGMNRGTAMAGLLAADYNYENQLGQLARQAEEYNLAQRQKVEEFNRATNMFNTEGALKADIANQEARLKARDAYLKGTLSAAELRQRERQQAAAARSANLSNFINSLGDIGRENFARNMITSDPSKYYWIDRNGGIHYKGAYDTLSSDEKKEVDKEIRSKTRSAANGGYLTRRKKRR